tara:strand:+ start:263 stop:448 length:186 start_codon:yes stop_codon:yes gene_type:complete
MPNNMSLGLVFSHSYKTEGADYIVFSTKAGIKSTEDFVTVVENDKDKKTGAKILTPIPTKD